MLTLLLIVTVALCEVIRCDACVVNSQCDDLLITGEQGSQLEQQIRLFLDFWPSGFL